MAKSVKPKKIKFSKVAIVMFLTVLIWVYADLALDDTHLVQNVPISISGPGDSELWATFKNEDGLPTSSIAIERIVLKGPASRVAEVKRDLNSGLLKFAFSLNPEIQNMTAGSNNLDLLDFVRKSEQIRGLGGLTVESCEPNMITVEVVKLVERELNIQAFDESERILELEDISPLRVSIFVPEDRGQNKVAQVRLTPSEIVKARVTATSKRPYVVLADGQERRSGTVVEIKLRPEEDKLTQFTISRVTVGYSYSPVTQGKYRAVPSNETELSSEIKILATPEAKAAYDAQRFHVTVEVDDDDSSGNDVTRALKYNLPEEYVRSGEIKLAPDHERAEAQFKLVPLPSAEGP